MASDIWVNSTLSVAGTSIPTMVSSPTLNYNNREIILANGSANALFGYAPGAAQSGFSIRTLLFTANANTILNALLNTAGIAIAMQLGATGGAHSSNCFCNSCTVSGAENGDIDMAATFETFNPPTPGGTVATASGFGSPWHFNDVTSMSLPGGTTATKLTAFSWRVTRRLARYQGNSPHGLPTDLKIAVTTAALDGTHQKLNDTEATAAVTTPKVKADCAVTLTQVDAASPASLILAVLSAFHNQYPQPVGAVTDYISEQVSVLAEQGGFSVT